MSRDTTADDISLTQHIRVLALVAVLSVATIFVTSLITLKRPLTVTALILYALLSLALAARYIPWLRGWPRDTLRRYDRLWIFLGAGLALAVVLLIQGEAMLYFYLVTLEGYLLFSFTRPSWSVAWAVGTVALTLVSHFIILRQWPTALLAVLEDVPWYVLSLLIIAAAKNIYDDRDKALQAKLTEAYGQMQDHIARAEALAMAQERARLAREIHDTLGHTLTALDVQLELIVQLSANSNEDCERVARHARALVKDGLSEVRRAVKALRPGALEVLSLSEAIASLTADYQERTHIDVIWHVEGEVVPLSSRLAVPLYRAAQEALTNVSRYAEATQVVVTLGFEREAIHLTVEDNGQASESSRQNGGAAVGFGLRGLRERAEALRGEFQAGPARTGGFRVEMKLPRWVAPRRAAIDDDEPVQFERLAAADISDIVVLLAQREAVEDTVEQ
ncbi:MAG TPA: hypothetical protein DEP84_21405 [Chloroflexi bacterium]|nr:hypothetical protein [Chloroflexota bacterium]